MRRFAELYDGNGVEAARHAGFKGDPATLASTAYRLLRNDEVRELISARSKDVSILPLIMSREERQELWSRLAVDPGVEPTVRLRASELLGKSQADFTEKLEVKGELTLLDLIREARGKKP
jgi:phage terminase small subunit